MKIIGKDYGQAFMYWLRNYAFMQLYWKLLRIERQSDIAYPYDYYVLYACYLCKSSMIQHVITIFAITHYWLPNSLLLSPYSTGHFGLNKTERCSRLLASNRVVKRMQQWSMCTIVRERRFEIAGFRGQKQPRPRIAGTWLLRVDPLYAGPDCNNTAARNKPTN